jgi:hypothetical protein
MECRGLEGVKYSAAEKVNADPTGQWLHHRVNQANIDTAKSIWQLVDDDYKPIDWHLDFKSGYRWSELTWHADIPIGHMPSVDVKVPWELSRCNHFPQLAIAYHLVDELQGDFGRKELAREFRNETLDFAATNPPCFGVNWRCPMDVAIRLVNWLVAFDLFVAAGAEFDVDFKRILTASLYDHAQFVVKNLEWFPYHRSNHYLANVLGTLFAGAYLPRSPEVDSWLAFGVQELLRETNRQFHEEGSNFEASTSYHRLSAEMVAFGTALVLALRDNRIAALQSYDHRRIRGMPRLEPAPIALHHDTHHRPSVFSQAYFERLGRMAEFTMAITKPNGRIHQVGDNDSGRMLKLEPSWRLLERKSDSDAVAEDSLDHRHLVAGISGIVNRSDFQTFTQKSWIDHQVCRHLVSSNSPHLQIEDSGTIRIRDSWRVHTTPADAAILESLKSYATRLPQDPRDLRDLQRFAFPQFGLYLWRSPQFYLAVRCGSVGLHGKGPHAHNDQLGIELNVHGRDLLADPGSYLYTADPVRRNAYRSILAHYGPCPTVVQEPCPLDLGVFYLPDYAKCECLVFEQQRFLGRHWGFGRPVYREVLIERDSIIVVDHAPPSLPLRLPFSNATTLANHRAVMFSSGYGISDAA